MKAKPHLRPSNELITSLTRRNIYLNSDKLRWALLKIRQVHNFDIANIYFFQQLLDDWTVARKYISPISEGKWKTIKGFTPHINSKCLLIPAITSTNPGGNYNHWMLIARFPSPQSATHTWDFCVVDSMNFQDTYDEAIRYITGNTTLHTHANLMDDELTQTVARNDFSKWRKIITPQQK